MSTVDEVADRCRRAAATLASAVIEGTDSTAARAQALRILRLSDGFAFAVCLAELTGAAWHLAGAAAVQAAGIDAVRAGHSVLTLQSHSGEPVNLDESPPPVRAAFRAVLAAANGDSPVPFLTSVPDSVAAQELVQILIHLFETGTRSTHKEA